MARRLFPETELPTNTRRLTRRRLPLRLRLRYSLLLLLLPLLRLLRAAESDAASEACDTHT